jgi:hypothetical protein
MTTDSLALIDDKSLLALVSGGDCSRLNEQQKISYYRMRCEAAGLDPRTAPFEFVSLQGKLKLYATKVASDQLASNHGIRLTIVSQATEADIRVVTVRAESRDGRVTEDIGALNIQGLKGEALGNALMKTVTKAKRRAILSLCGLGMLDETEVETVPREREQQPRKAAATVTVTEVPSLPPAEEPPHDPQTGEVIEAVADAQAAQQKAREETKARLLAMCAAGWKDWEEKRAWSKANKAAKETLSAADQEEVSAAFVAAHPQQQKPTTTKPAQSAA